MYSFGVECMSFMYVYVTFRYDPYIICGMQFPLCSFFAAGFKTCYDSLPISGTEGRLPMQLTCFRQVSLQAIPFVMTCHMFLPLVFFWG